MREFLFRGKRKDNGEWIIRDNIAKCAYEVDDETKELIEVYSYYLNGVVVDANTIGQYTGLTDKNGKKIFEGDIVNVNTNKDSLCHRYEGRNLVIRFDEYHRFVASGRLEYPLCNHYEWEVIGNIHDNPELLKGGVG